ncbi:MAG: S8 family serine peptidase [Anaerolineales bacterium]|nr:S8 family serine peptidase [Anaerolineales bacterium]MCA9931270.1 S8 family serine peptidase [Anaerolineales bacterium]
MFKSPKNRMVRRIVLSSLLLILSLLFAASLEAKSSNVDSYIVVMEQRPVIAYDGDVAGLPATRPRAGGKINPDSYSVRQYQRYLQKTHAASLEAAGASANQQVHNYTVSLNGYSALLTADQVKEIEGQAGVVRVMKDELRQATTDSSPEFLGISGRGGAWAAGLTGEGVVVGVIDSGIWPEHPSFADDGSYAAPPITVGECDFGNTAQNPADAPFACNNKLIGARQMLDTYRAVIGADANEFDSARDDNGHGTHTASTAAGNAGVAATVLGVPRGTVSGIAPRAHIVAYKGLGNLGGFGSDLAAAIDQAVADGVDVINYSIGGGASLAGADDIAYLFAADAGVFVATSNGNSGPAPYTVGGPASVPWLTSVGASTQSRSYVGSASSSDGWEFFGVSITGGTTELPLVDAADHGDELCQPGALDAGVAGKIVLCKRGIYDRVQKSQAVLIAGGAGMILYNANDGQTVNSDSHWVPSVHINNTDGLVIKDYIANSANPVAQINAGTPTMVDAPFMAGFSSRGPNPVAEDLIKPDVTAPGVQILAGDSPVNYGTAPQGELFQAIAGTSMSSPHVAGIFALIKQAHPDWSPAMAKSALMTTAYQDVMKEDGVTPADPFDMGAGHVNPGNPATNGSAFRPGLVYDAGLFEYAAFTCGMDLGVFTPGSCTFLEGIGVPTDPSDLNVPSIAVGSLAGSQTVQRTVTSVAPGRGSIHYTASVDAPPGIDVTVNPSSFSIAYGESVTYEITFTANAGAVLDEYAFGSITWTSDPIGRWGNQYDVYSPIAIRPSAFAAPDAISGSGETGAASFDVNFGYTGDYTAAAHGLESAIVINDNVVQDPDQNFDPNDGFSDAHAFALSGAAYLRVAIPPEAVANGDIDLDVFVADPSGTIVAASTNGATDEQVDIALPSDGTWTVYVHGWQTAGASADYTLYAWVISATPGGNMSIDSAPASAVIGTTGTIDVSWTGATAGEWHLGAVSHSDASGLLGLTLVDVDNR